MPHAASLNKPEQDRSQSSILDEKERQILNEIRIIALDCRTAARADLFKACALLSNNRSAARDAHAHARALVQCLRQATGQNPIFYRLGTTELSFNEAWVMQAITTIQQGDLHSFEFLIRSRIPKLQQRNIEVVRQNWTAC